LVAVTVAVLFAACLFFEPLFSSIPAFATAPALIYVAIGFLGGLRQIEWSDMSIALPVVLTVFLMPLTFSIAAGISIGFLSYVAIRILSGKSSTLSPGIMMITSFGLIWIVLQYAV
jgi:AGZA family xanthine/uracil permease-like MFS transporter